MDSLLEEDSLEPSGRSISEEVVSESLVAEEEGSLEVGVPHATRLNKQIDKGKRRVFSCFVLGNINAKKIHLREIFSRKNRLPVKEGEENVRDED